MIVLVDCDNFFASCERIMQPTLLDVPVAVLSNNDGCVIARTAEVKTAGVLMGQPYHECKAILDRIGAVTLSANFLLYRHFAKRLQTILRSLPAISIEVYSIDESFIEIPNNQIDNYQLWAETLRTTIMNWTGLPVSVGIAPTRTLAKLAVRVAKKSPSGVSVISGINDPATKKLLHNTDITDVWGIGRRLGPKLRLCGIENAWDLMSLTADSPTLRLLDKPTLQLISELRGGIAFTSSGIQARKSIMHSRSFGQKASDVAVLRSVLVDFSGQVAGKLRKKQLVADRIIFGVRYRVEGKKHGASKIFEVRFNWTNNSFVFAAAAERAAHELFEKGKHYMKASVYCPQLQHNQQLSLYDSAQERQVGDSLMQAIDELERRYGAAGPQIGTKLLNNSWRGKRQYMSPYNHSEWGSLPPVVAN